jgi:molecular chaperone GrpE
MVKKKTHDEADAVKGKHIETPENKDNNKSKEQADTSPGDESVPDYSMKSSDGTADEKNAAPDKVVVEERSFEEKLAEMQDKYLRLSAEFDNYRKRTLREKIELTKYAAEETLLKILPVMDDFERALSHLDIAQECSAVKDGLDLIYNKFSEFLKQQGIKEIDALNCPFNFELHDAVAKVPVEEEEKKGKNVEVILKGYYLNDKVIRHSKVVVGE